MSFWHPVSNRHAVVINWQRLPDGTSKTVGEFTADKVPYELTILNAGQMKRRHASYKTAASAARVPVIAFPIWSAWFRVCVLACFYRSLWLLTLKMHLYNDDRAFAYGLRCRMHKVIDPHGYEEMAKARIAAGKAHKWADYFGLNPLRTFDDSQYKEAKSE